MNIESLFFFLHSLPTAEGAGTDQGCQVCFYVRILSLPVFICVFLRLNGNVQHIKIYKMERLPCNLSKA